MWVKICANTNLEDARLAVELGADAVGFVFAPSSRRVSVEDAAAMVRGLPRETETIGVFTSREAAEILAAVRGAGLTGVQLHGGFDLELARALRRELGDAVSILLTLHWKVDGETGHEVEVREQLAAAAQEPTVDRVLIDSKTSSGAGGSGVRFDWQAARQTLAGHAGKLIVAGGLRPENVAEATDALTPWGVDVASGVEAAPGRKDGDKLRRFIENAKGRRF